MQLTLRKSNLSRGRPKIIIDEFTASAIRRVVLSFYRIREHPTLDKVLARCEEDVVDLPKLSRSSFWRLLQSMGLSYRRTKGNRQIMMEKPEIVAKRHTFLREVRELSDSGCPIVCLEETWVKVHHTVTSKWYDCSANPGRDAVQARRRPYKERDTSFCMLATKEAFSLTVLSFLLVKPILSTIMMK